MRQLEKESVPSMSCAQSVRHPPQPALKANEPEARASQVSEESARKRNEQQQGTSGPVSSQGGNMQTYEILAVIDGQISQLQQARALLTGNETAARLTGKKRGRPKGSGAKKTGTSVPQQPRAGKRTMSAEGKARIAAAQKVRWAAQKKKVQPAAKEAVSLSGSTPEKFASKPKRVIKKKVSAKKAVAAPAESPAETTTS